MVESRWRLILNGKCSTHEGVREAVHALRGQGIDLGVRATWEAGDAAHFASCALGDDLDTLIAAGGDGTLSEIAAAMAASDTSAADLPSLGLMPLGTANDFAAAAQIPEEPAEALELVRAQRAHPIDLLRIEADDEVYWAINLVSGGFGTEATADTQDGLKNVLGGLAYLIGGMSKLGQIEPIMARVHAPDFSWEGGFIALGVGNGRQAGGGLALCPEAIIDDGLLDLTIVPELEGEVAATIATVLSEGSDAALERVAETARLPWVEIESPQPFTLNLDGEPVEASRFRIECIAGRVRMHLPPGCPLLGVPGNPVAGDAHADDAGDLPGLVPV